VLNIGVPMAWLPIPSGWKVNPTEGIPVHTGEPDPNIISFMGVLLIHNLPRQGPAAAPSERQQAQTNPIADSHHVAGRLSSERRWDQPEPRGPGRARTEWLPLLLMLLDLLGDALKDLLELLKLRRDNEQQLLQVRELLLLKDLQLLELLRNGLQQLRSLL
jgi:hypothetical protein